MPSKIVKPVDSIICISAYIIKLLKTENLHIDALYNNINDEYIKKISFEKYMLCLNFLYITNSIRIKNEIITVKIR